MTLQAGRQPGSRRPPNESNPPSRRGFNEPSRRGFERRHSSDDLRGTATFDGQQVFEASDCHNVGDDPSDCLPSRRGEVACLRPFQPSRQRAWRDERRCGHDLLSRLPAEVRLRGTAFEAASRRGSRSSRHDDHRGDLRGTVSLRGEARLRACVPSSLRGSVHGETSVVAVTISCRGFPPR